MKNALILAGINWNDTLQRHHQFAYYLVKCGYEVDFVEHIISTRFSFNKLAQVLKKSRKEGTKHVNSINKNIRVITPGFINPGGFPLSIYNCLKANKLLQSLSGNYDIIIDYLPIKTTKYIINHLSYDTLIYDCVRNFESWGGYYEDIIAEEKWLMNKCDVIFTDSYFLTDKCKQIPDKKVCQFLPIANDNWTKGCFVKEIKTIKDIAYFGTVDQHIDVNLLKFLTQKGYKIHIWGVVNIPLDFEYVYHGYIADQSVLANDIITASDAIIIPYIGNMDGVIPAKIIQCLAARIPVFVSDFYDSKKLTAYLYTYQSAADIYSKLINFEINDYKEKVGKSEKFIETLNEKTQFQEFKNIVENLI